MAAVILAPNGRPAAPGNPVDVRMPLYIARDSSKQPIGECNVCRDRGEHTIFYSGEETAFHKHLNACAEEFQERMQMTQLRHTHPLLFDPNQAGDVDLERWMRHNGAAILRGDLKP